MSAFSCYELSCDHEIEFSCSCTFPPTYSCNVHLIKHCQSSDENHNLASAFLKPVEETKEAILNFLKEQKSKTYEIKIKLLTFFYKTLYNYKIALEEILKEIDSDSTKIGSNFDKVFQTEKILRIEKDPVLNLLILQSDQAIEKAKEIFTTNNNVESFRNMGSQLDNIISNYNKEKSKVFNSIQTELNFDNEAKNIQLPLNEYKEAIRANPHNSDAYNCIGDIFYYEKRYEEALKYYMDAITINQNCAIYYANEGIALDELGRKEEAMECYKQAIKIDPNNANAYNGIGVIFYNEGRYEEALKYYNDASSIDPNSALLQRNKGIVLKELGRTKEAIECYKEAIRLDPDEDGSYIGLGIICSYEKRYEEALEYYNDAIRINPTKAIYYKNKGDALRNLGRREEAIECFNEAIEHALKTS